jgi:2-polyprenyl-6-methoxyphenol hydroxylase-like FAD-dependent oxidoreductase
VIGGSFAGSYLRKSFLTFLGLLAASVLAQHSRKVIVIERTSKRDQGGSIAPQGKQFHVLMRRGLQVTEKLFGPSFGTTI